LSHAINEKRRTVVVTRELERERERWKRWKKEREKWGREREMGERERSGE